MSKKGFHGKGNRPIRGDDDDNVLTRFGIDGRFQFNAGDGNDEVHGGIGIDYVNAGDGDDDVWTYEGEDDIHGGDGNDFIDSGADNDMVKGGDGDDEILAGSGDDEVKGGLGSDDMDGGDDYDTAAGYDELYNYVLTFDTPCVPSSLSAIDDTRNADHDTLVNFEEVHFKDFILFTDGTNNNPYAVDDTAAAGEDDGTVDIDLLANDIEFECEVMTVTSIDESTLVFGTVIDNGDGTVTYDFGDSYQFLGTGEEATATFSYTVGDGAGNFGTADVEVTITGSNDAPILVDEAPGSVSYTEADPAVIVFSDLTLTDVDDDDMESAKIVITDFVVGDVLSMDAGYAGSLIATYDALTGELELTVQVLKLNMKTRLSMSPTALLL
ncbi:Ig-like domain-containing protein [Kiloniella sp.]|uniref:Ig-like domain-containing protein n=1 Tax=Kiloniella sp. TaxID=1938587 RepID=UPI003B013765